MNSTKCDVLSFEEIRAQFFEYLHHRDEHSNHRPRAKVETGHRLHLQPSKAEVAVFEKGLNDMHRRMMSGIAARQSYLANERTALLLELQALDAQLAALEQPVVVKCRKKTKGELPSSTKNAAITVDLSGDD
jgi:hypothetical protein